MCFILVWQDCILEKGLVPADVEDSKGLVIAAKLGMTPSVILGPFFLGWGGRKCSISTPNLLM